MNYIFSYYSKDRIPQIKRRPWWNLFGRDSIEYVEQYQRHIFTDVSEEEGAILMSAGARYWDTPTGKLLLRLMRNKVWGIQLEEDYSKETTSSYISTTSTVKDSSK